METMGMEEIYRGTHGMGLGEDRLKEVIKCNLGLPRASIEDFTAWVAKKRGVSLDEAKQTILNNEKLLELAFILT